MPPNTAADQTRVAFEAKCWERRQLGHSQRRIAEQLGVSQAAVSRALRRVERRELARLSATVECEKVHQTYVLDHIVCEAMRGFERSKGARRRASTRSGGRGGAVETTEVFERDGDPAFLVVAMQAMADVRQIWGLNAAPGVGTRTTYAQVVANVKANAARFDDARAALPPPDGATDA